MSLLCAPLEIVQVYSDASTTIDQFFSQQRRVGHLVDLQIRCREPRWDAERHLVEP